MSGSRVTFMGDAMAPVVQGVIEVRDLTGQPPVIVGGLAVLSRLSRPYRATVDLDVVDRLLWAASEALGGWAFRTLSPMDPDAEATE